MSTDLVPMNQQMLSLRSMDDLDRFAKTISQSIFVPQPFRGKPGDVIAAVLYGMERGLSPMASLQNVAVINGKPSVYGDMLLAICLSDPSTESIEEAETSEIDETHIAWCTAKRTGRKLIRRTFSQKDAERAKLWGKPGPWQEYPSRMLMMRARSWCLRDAYADRLMGLQAREEAQDIIDVTPEPAPIREAPVSVGTAKTVEVQGTVTAPAPSIREAQEAPFVPNGQDTAVYPSAQETPGSAPGLTASATLIPPAEQEASRQANEETMLLPVDKLSRQEAIFRIQTRLGELVGKKTDDAARQQKRALTQKTFGQALDTWEKVVQLPLSALRAGVTKLMAQPLPGEHAAEADVPMSDAPQCTTFWENRRCTLVSLHEGDHVFGEAMPSPQEGPQVPPGETIADTGDPIVTNGDGPSPDAEEAPAEPRMNGRVVMPEDVGALMIWAGWHRQQAILDDMLRGAVMEGGLPVMSKARYQAIREAVFEAIEAGKEATDADHAATPSPSL